MSTGYQAHFISIISAYNLVEEMHDAVFYLLSIHLFCDRGIRPIAGARQREEKSLSQENLFSSASKLYQEYSSLHRLLFLCPLHLSSPRLDSIPMCSPICS